MLLAYATEFQKLQTLKHEEFLDFRYYLCTPVKSCEAGLNQL